jgi:hypothetical protein
MGKSKTQKSANANKQSSQARHERDCKICHHPKREEIEREWTRWGDTTSLAARHRLSRDSIYRYAHATALFAKRQRNIRAALEQIIEKVSLVEVTAPAVVSAIQAYAKINAQGQWIERVERVGMRAVFDRMTREELDVYARTGELPTWSRDFSGAAPFESTEEDASD